MSDVVCFQFKVKVMSKSRWLSNAILKTELLNDLSYNDDIEMSGSDARVKLL